MRDLVSKIHLDGNWESVTAEVDSGAPTTNTNGPWKQLGSTSLHQGYTRQWLIFFCWWRANSFLHHSMKRKKSWFLWYTVLNIVGPPVDPGICRETFRLESWEGRLVLYNVPVNQEGAVFCLALYIYFSSSIGSWPNVFLQSDHATLFHQHQRCPPSIPTGCFWVSNLT